MELKKYKLGDICDIFAGGDAPKNVTTERSEKNCIPIYSNGIVNEGLYGYTDVAKITSKAFTVSARGTIGISFKRNEPYYPIVRLLSVIPKNNNVDLDYLYYNSKMLIFKKDGSVQQQLTVPMLSEVEIKIPSIEYQRKIASVLSSLDNKIALNRRINAKLEQIAKRLYDYWFVQFDFPDKNGKPYKSSGGKMVWNEVLKREVPEGWEVKRICDIAKTYSGGTPKSTEIQYYENGNIPWINSGELNEPIIVEAHNYITEMGLHNSSAKFYPENTILVALYGATAGKVSLLTFKATSNQAVCGVISENKIASHYLYLFMSSLYDHYVKLSTGSARDNISQDTIKQTLVCVPERNVLLYFDNIISPIFNKITKHQKEISALTALRDRLLPLLMNGQVEVKG